MSTKRSRKENKQKRTESAVNITMASSEHSSQGVKIPAFSGNKGESAKFWLAKFEQVMKLKKVNNEEKTIQLFLLLEGQAEMWYHTLGDDIQGNYKNLRTAFVERFLPSDSDRIANVSHFRGLVQMAQESTDDYIEKVIRLGQDLEKSEQEIIDQVYQGLNPAIMKFVITKEPKTLADVKRFSRMGQSLEKDTTVIGVNEVQGRRWNRQTGKCDFQFTHSNEKSRYQNKRCYICNRTSHLARDCWFRYDQK